MGIFTAYDQQNQSPEKLEELYQFGRSLAPDAPTIPAPMPVPDFQPLKAGSQCAGVRQLWQPPASTPRRLCE